MPRTKRRNPVVDELSADTAAADAGALPPRMERFCQEYTVDFNGARAARAAGYSVRRARHTASELLDRPDVQKRLATLLAAHMARVDYSRDAVLRQLGAVLNANLRDIVKLTKGGGIALRSEADIPDEAWLAISEIGKDKDGRIRVKLHNKLGAIDYMGRVHKLWEGAGVGSVNLTVRLVRELGAPTVRKVG